jgi:HAD superfamily phosphoserine phosphatase-like hydrolase
MKMKQDKEEVKVVVFDLNLTFYNKSSKDEFYKFVCARQPQKLATYFEMAYYKVLLKLHKINKTEFKENFFNYLDNLPPHEVEAYAEEFWQQEFPDNFNQDLKKRFDKLREEGVRIYCATGGLELYVKPLFKLYEIDGLVGTRVKYENNTYLVEGKACKDDEKIKRVEKDLDGKPFRIIEAYSDSKETILEKAEKAYLVDDGEIKPYKPD